MKSLTIEFNSKNEARYFEYAVGKHYSLDKLDKERSTEFYVKCEKVEITGIKNGLLYLYFELGNDTDNDNDNDFRIRCESFSVALNAKSICKLTIYDI